MNQSYNLLGSLHLLGRRSLEILVGGRIIAGLKERTRSKGIVRKIIVAVRGEVEGGTGEVDVGEVSF